MTARNSVMAHRGSAARKGMTLIELLVVVLIISILAAIAQPRMSQVIVKARAKLRGELDPDLMFCCGGDRKFLADHGGIHPADFLRQVWAAGEDDTRIAAYVRRCTNGN